MGSAWDIIHQERAEAQLQRAIAGKRLGHTFLFTGLPGVGKFKTAMALAETMLCDQPVVRPNGGDLPLPEDFPLRRFCGHCPSCRAVETGIHPDVHVVARELVRFYDARGKSKATTLSIQVIRAEIIGLSSPELSIEAKIYKRPVRGPGKWFIIDDAHLMDIPAQNALLKTLEEPPPHSYLILIAASEQELLPTIRSRAQTIRFHPLPEEAVTQALVARGAPERQAAAIARIARGSLGAAAQFQEDSSRIDQRQQEQAQRAARAGAKAKPADAEPEFTAGGAVAWAAAMEGIVNDVLSRRAAAGAIAETMLRYAAEYARLQLLRDKLASKDRAQRDGIMLLLRFAADACNRRLHAVCSGTPQTQQAELLLDMIDHARQIEAQVDQNANLNIALAAFATGWKSLASGGAAVPPHSSLM